MYAAHESPVHHPSEQAKDWSSLIQAPLWAEEVSKRPSIDWRFFREDRAEKGKEEETEEATHFFINRNYL